jgi:glycosidase
MQEFEQLIDRTHQEGLSVIIDFVPNHVARDYQSIAKPSTTDDLGAADDPIQAFSPHNNFYYIPNEKLIIQGTANAIYEEFPAKATGNDRFDAHPTANDWYETVKLNYGIDYQHNREKFFSPVPDTWKKMLNILIFWASKGIDGFRCDMAEMVPAEFWHWAIACLKAHYPTLLFIAEVYNPAEYRNYVNSGFDYLYDKVGLYDTIRNVICGHEPTSAISRCWQQAGDLLPQLLNFLENHDEQRIASEFFAGDPFAAIPGMIVSATINTNPVMIYNGQEVGEKGMDSEGFSGLDGRTTIFDYWSMSSLRAWNNGGRFDGKQLSPEQQTLRNFYVTLLTLCTHESAISEGLFYDLMYANYDNPLFNSAKQYAFLRANKSSVLLIAVNFDRQEATVSIKIPAHAFQFLNITGCANLRCNDLLSGEYITQDFLPDATIQMQLAASHGRIFRCS